MYHNPLLPIRGLNFEPPAPGTQERTSAKNLRMALFDLLQAQKDLQEAEENIPSYTAQWSEEDYVRDQQQTLIAASHAFEQALIASVKEHGG